MKKNLLAVLTVAALGVSAQTPRLSLYEEFTGENCGPCAATNPGLNALLLTPANQQKIVAIKWQVPIPSAPSPTWSLYKTNKAEIDWRHLGWNGGYSSTVLNPPSASGYGYTSQTNSSSTSTTSGVNSAPSGRIDGQPQFMFGTTSNHPAQMTQAVINTAQSYTAAFSITMTRAWDPTYSAINLTVNILATANFTSVGSLVFRTVMVEREISFDSPPGTNGEKFFEDVAVKSFPSIQNGTPLASGWIAGQTYSFTLNCPIPSYVRDKSQLAMVGFIQDDGDRKVAQAVRADREQFNFDAKAIAATVPVLTCSNSFVPTIDVENVGLNTITNLTVTPYINGSAQTDFYWTGTLAPSASVSIPMNALTIPAGNVTFSYNISGVNGTDYNTANNFKSKPFLAIQNYQGAPVAEGFVNAAFPPANWAIVNQSGGGTWQRVTTTGGFGLSSNAVKLDLYGTVVPNSVHDLLLPPMSFTMSMAPKLTFDVAYSQYNGENDLLEVLASKDCGASWSTVYSKSGSNLSTTGSNITSVFTPASTQWRTETVTLTGFANADVLVKFRATSDYGNNLYLDNVNLKQECTTQTVSITAPNNNLLLCLGQTTTLTATGATSYSWSSGQNAASIVITPTANGTYSATSTDQDACGNGAAVSVTVQNCTSLENHSTVAVQVFPNPNSGEFTVAGDFKSGSATLEVFNNLGQHVYTQVLASGTNQVKCQLPAGVYHFTVSDNRIVEKQGTLILR